MAECYFIFHVSCGENFVRMGNSTKTQRINKSERERERDCRQYLGVEKMSEQKWNLLFCIFVSTMSWFLFVVHVDCYVMGGFSSCDLQNEKQNVLVINVVTNDFECLRV